MEETHLNLEINSDFSVKTEYDLPNGNHKKMTLFTAELNQQNQIKLQNEEIKNSGWFNYSDARQQLTYDNLKGLLDQVDKHLTEK
ncbi:NUDIX hydrolase [Paucilactobacillus suebicus DSM 5007 = KCTC 3549]|uniref:NUDIX hydrolase n=1 Tax=Paucilactobacillus suebicus DSM 5007 = KCTC 3549 TaxID=1423807 RepID=A0A0R1W5C3_9LACO|nr:NUDIX hydrolase [Paucilactobacillus suebicus DSM 5007 = KCTC 3549]